MSEWCSLVAGGRRLEEVCVWVTAVVDRLVTRNTHFTDIRYVCLSVHLSICLSVCHALHRHQVLRLIVLSNK